MSDSRRIPPGLRYTARLATTGGHELFFAEFGAADGLPVLHLHGGPGSGANPADAELFDLDHVRLVLFDQRGAGESTPAGSVEQNDLARLLDDIERLREHLGVERWLLYGGSWGGTLALAYAKAHRQRVLGLVLRAPFLARTKDLDWYIGPSGAARVLPDDYARLNQALGQASDQAPDQTWGSDRGGDELIERMHTLLFSVATSEPAVTAACIAWSNWERALMGLPPRPSPGASPDVADATLLQRQRIHVHYCRHRFFLGAEGVLPSIESVAELPCHILHGEDDRVCLPEASRALIDRCPRWHLTLIPGAGHGFDHLRLRLAVSDALLDIAARAIGG